MEQALQYLGRMMFALRAIMSFFYIGLIIVILYVLYKFGIEVISIFSPNKTFTKMELIIKVLELVDMTMVAQLVWVVALAGFSLFVTAQHFSNNAEKQIEKPDWLDHVNTYNLKLKLAFAIVSISGVHALKTYLQGSQNMEDVLATVIIHFLFVISAVGIAFAERLTHQK